MGGKFPKSLILISLIFFFSFFVFLLFLPGFVSPAQAQSPGCISPTGLPCTPTPHRIRANNTPTDTLPPLPTFTSTVTPSPTITPTPSPTITLIPTSTPNPTPTPFNPFPIFKPITNLIGLLHPPENTVALLPPWMQPDNLKITDLEITQAVQCLHNPSCPDNSVALYQGKTTMVRAYVRLTTGPDSYVYPIGGALCYGNTGAGGCSNPIRPIQKIFVENEPDPVSYGRQAITATLDFILPLSYVESGVTQSLTVYVNYNFEDLPSESYYKDNYKTLDYQVQTSEPIYIRYYPVQDAGYFPPAMEWATINDYISKTYPTSEVYPSLGFPLFGKNYAWSAPGNGCPQGWNDLLHDLWLMRGGSGPIAYGEAPNQSLTGGTGGCGYMGDPEAAGMAGTSLDGRVAAQEVGHTLNLPHIPGCGAGGPDLNYPKPNGLLDEVGTDVYTYRIYYPSSSYDFMGYCGGGPNTWTSIYTYNEIADLLPAGSFRPALSQRAVFTQIALTTPKFLVGSGELSPTKAAVTDGFYLLGKDSVNPVTLDKGAYTIELQDQNGKVLYSQHFDVAQLSNDNPQAQGSFQLVIPWTDGTHRVVFKYQDKIIGNVVLSPNAPILTLTSPLGGEHWSASGKQTISWKASDADGNPLSYLVQFSPDGGQTWEMLAASLHTDSFSFDLDYLPGSTQGLIRVSATDGLNTTQVVSQPITVDPKAPMLSIASPQDGQSFDYGTPVILRGFGADLRDGSLTGDQLQWSSNKDGNLGTGNTLISQKLSVGDHILSLSAQNSSGLASTVSIHIKINPPLTTQKSVGGTSLLDYLVLGVLCPVVLAAVLLTVFFVRRRRLHSQAS